MVCLNRVFDPYKESQPFHHILNLSGYIDPYTLLTKSGDPLCILELSGPDGYVVTVLSSHAGRRAV